MCNVDTLRGICLATILEITLEMRCTVLVSVDRFAIQSTELSGDDFQEVLEHILRFVGLEKYCGQHVTAVFTYQNSQWMRHHLGDHR